MKFMQINDWHLSDRPPRYRTESYNDDIFAKLEYAVNMDASVQFYVVPGDIFHQPQASKVSHNLVNRLLLFLDDVTCPIYIIPGNHDLAAGRVESLSKQPIGTIATHPNVILLEDGKVYSVDGLTIAGVAWNYAIDANYIRSRLSRKVDVLVLHAPIMPSVNPFFDIIRREELTGLADIILYGHIHIPEQPTAVDGTLFVNSGGISRGSLTLSIEHHLADDADRKPMIAIVDVDNVSARYIELAHRPKHEVFKLDLHEAKTVGNEAISRFVANLGKAKVSSVSIEDLIMEANKLAGDPKVSAAIEELLYSVQ